MNTTSENSSALKHAKDVLKAAKLSGDAQKIKDAERALEEIYHNAPHTTSPNKKNLPNKQNPSDKFNEDQSKVS